MLSARESGEGPEMQSFTISTDSIFFSFEVNRRFVTSSLLVYNRSGFFWDNFLAN